MKTISLVAACVGGFFSMQAMELSSSALEEAVKKGDKERVRTLVTQLSVAAPKETIAGGKIGAPVKARLVMTMGGEYKTVPVQSSQTQGELPVRMEVGTRTHLDRNVVLTSALIEAVRHGHLDIVKMLVDELGANIDSKKGIEGNYSTSALGYALQLQDKGHDRRAIIDFLVSKGS